MAWQGRLGGFLGEALVGATLGVGVLLALAPFDGRLGRTSWIRRAAGALATLLILAVASASIARWPEPLRAACPWLSGAALLVGLGALAARRITDPASEARAAGGLALLLLGNVVGPLAVLGLPGLALLDRVRRGRWIGRAATIVGALAAAWWMRWIPYQLPSQELPLIPGTQEAIGPLSTVLLVPLLVLAGAAAAWFRRPTWGLLAIPLLVPLLLSGA